MKIKILEDRIRVFRVRTATFLIGLLQSFIRLATVAARDRTLGVQVYFRMILQLALQITYLKIGVVFNQYSMWLKGEVKDQRACSFFLP
jgi:hypothetical protein